MKKIILLLTLVISQNGFSQITVFSENFGTNTQMNQITQIPVYTGDWLIDDGSNSPSPPAGPGSGNSMLFGQDASAAGTTESVVTIAINASTYSSLNITWNSLRLSSSSPAVSFSISTSGTAGTWTNVAYTNNSNNNVWAAVPSVALPSNAISATLYLCWSYVSTGSASEYIAIDDILLTGVGSPVFYWDGSAALTNTASWWDSPTFTGLNPTSFTVAGQTFNIFQPTATLSTAWTVSGAGSAVYVGDGTVPNQCHLTLASGGVLTLSSAMLNVTGNSTLTLVDPSFPAVTSVSISTLSTVEFGQVGGSTTIWNPTSYGNLFLSGGGSKLQPASNITVAGEFNIASGTNYNMVNSSTRTTKLQGKVTCSGNISTNYSNLTFEGSGTIGTVNFTGATAINNLTMNRSGQNLTLAGSALNVSGVVTASVGTIASGTGKLSLKASTTAGRNGRIGPITGNITGSIRVETRAPGGFTDWAVLGPSGVSGLTVASWEGQIPMSCFSCPNNEYSAGGYFVSVQGWDETAPASSTVAYIEMSYTDPLSVGTGYWVYLGNGLSTTTDITWTVTAPIVKNNQSINLSNSTAANGDGYNLISNPYPCPISWSALRNGNASVDNAYYVYCAETGNTSSFVNGVSTPASGPGSLTDVIPMGQGFYARATANTNLTAQESNKVTSPVPFLNKPAANNGFLRLKIAGGGYSDETVVIYDNLATSNFDSEYDAHKMYASAGYVNNVGPWTKRTVIATQLNNVDYSINSLPAIAANSVLPVIARVYSTGSYTISAFDLNNISASTCVTLRDKLLNITHDLKTSDYVCNISDTTYASRFELSVCSSTITDVKTVAQQPVASDIAISKDVNGVYVKLNYEKPVDVKISVTNILGQTIMQPKKVRASKETMYLDINSNDQLIFVTVETNSTRTTKKILNNK